MQVSLSNHKSTEFVIRNLEVQVGQLAKQQAETSMNSFWANTEKNTKEECKVIFTGSQRRENAKKEKRAKGVLEDVSNEEGEYNKREESKENGENVLPTKTKSRQEKKVGEGLVDDLEEGSQCLIYLFFTLINFGDF